MKIITGLRQCPRNPANRAAVAGLLAVLACAAPAAGAGPYADPAMDRGTARVTLADLDLSTAQGVAAARQRLTRMAQHLCWTLRDTRRFDDQAAYAECTEVAVADALRQFDLQLAAGGKEPIAAVARMTR